MTELVCAVVVTHRRPDELAKSLGVLSTQSRLPDHLIVVDNDFSGDGAGRVRDLVIGQPSALTALPWVGHRSRTWEPEPARWAGVQGLYALYRLADRLESPVVPGKGVRVGEALGRVGDAISGIPH